MPVVISRDPDLVVELDSRTQEAKVLTRLRDELMTLARNRPTPSQLTQLYNLCVSELRRLRLVKKEQARGYDFTLKHHEELTRLTNMFERQLQNFKDSVKVSQILDATPVELPTFILKAAARSAPTFEWKSEDRWPEIVWRPPEKPYEIRGGGSDTGSVELAEDQKSMLPSGSPHHATHAESAENTDQPPVTTPALARQPQTNEPPVKALPNTTSAEPVRFSLNPEPRAMTPREQQFRHYCERARVKLPPSFWINR